MDSSRRQAGGDLVGRVGDHSIIITDGDGPGACYALSAFMAAGAASPRMNAIQT